MGFLARVEVELSRQMKLEVRLGLSVGLRLRWGLVLGWDPCGPEGPISGWLFFPGFPLLRCSGVAATVRGFGS